MSVNRTFRRWMSKSPAPEHLRVDGTILRLEGGRARWPTAEASIGAMQGKVVEAMAADGAVLRVMELETETEADKKATAKETELVQMSRLLKDAMLAGSQSNAEAYKTAFNAMMTLTTVLAKRLTTIETRYQRLFDKMDDGADGGDLDSLVAPLLVASMSGNKAEAQANGASKK